MKKITFIIISILITHIAYGQLESDTLYDDVQSSKYFFKAYIQSCPEGDSSCLEQCVIKIYSKKSNELFQELKLVEDESWGWFPNPVYGFDYIDLNFDGIKDFSIEYTSSKGAYCEGAKWFFIFDTKMKKFSYSKELTNLMYDYCYSEIDSKKKEVIGLIKNGLISFGDVHYIWKGNNLIKIFERKIEFNSEDSDYYYYYTVKKLVKGKWKVNKYKKKELL